MRKPMMIMLHTAATAAAATVCPLHYHHHQLRCWLHHQPRHTGTTSLQSIQSWPVQLVWSCLPLFSSHRLSSITISSTALHLAFSRRYCAFFSFLLNCLPYLQFTTQPPQSAATIGDCHLELVLVLATVVVVSSCSFTGAFIFVFHSAAAIFLEH